MTKEAMIETELRHRVGAGKAGAAATDGAVDSSKVLGNGSSMRLEPLPRSPPTAGGKRQLDGFDKEGAEEDDATTPFTAAATPVPSPPPPPSATDATAATTSSSSSHSSSASFGERSKLLALSRAFLSYPGEVIHTPMTGPAKVDMAEHPPHPLVQVLDFLLLFLIVHYVQIFYGGLALLCWRSHSVKPLLVALAAYLPLYFIPVQRMGGWPFTGFMNRPFWRCVQRALQIKIEREVELDPSRQYVFGWHPHGILLLSRFAIYGGLWAKLFPGIHFKTLAASPLFWVPPIREVSILLGAVDAGRAFASKALEDGFSVSLYPGGSKEIYTTNPYTAETKLVLRIRQGFIKLALRHGAPLVPIYIYGEKYAYHRLEQKTGFGNLLLSTLRVPFLVFWGRWCTFLPLRGTQVAVVVGKALEVPWVEEPTPEIVAEYLDKYCKEVEALFHRHKHKYGKPGETIEIS